MFSVNWVGKEKEFSSKDHAISFMKRLDADSDLWFGTSTLLQSRYKVGDDWKTKVYDYDGDDYVVGESGRGETKVVKLGPGAVVIDLGDEDALERCLPRFTKITPGFPK